MKLTRDEAINEFRRMWAWIALETYGCKQKAEKRDYMELFGFEDISNNCFLCEYDWQTREGGDVECKHCPIEFVSELGVKTRCGINSTAYANWCATPWYDWEKAAKYAWEIANLEEKIVRKYTEED